MMPVTHDEGVSSLQTDLPPSMQCMLTINAPVSFTEITVGNGFLQQQSRTGTLQRSTYLLSALNDAYEISWQPPVKTVTADTDIDTAGQEITSNTMCNKPVITVRQETALFVTKENNFTFITLHLSVVRAPVSSFTLNLPDSFVVLSLHGKGMQSSQPKKGGGTIYCKLSFQLEGDYTLYLAGETPWDSIVKIPAAVVKEATHQTGIFTLSVEKGTEAQLISAVNSGPISSNDFLTELSPGFSDSLMRYGHPLDNSALAGRYFRIPFTAEIKLQSHPPVAVADAVCDAGSLRTVISSDGKTLTQATYLVRQRGRQFVTLSLPDSANLWSVTLDGVPHTPSVDKNGSYKIPLQRKIDMNSSESHLLIELTYLQLSKDKKEAATFLMDAPVPNIPVSRLDWTVFYPEAWSVIKVDGSFITAHKKIIGKQYFHLVKNERQSLYSKLQQTNASQQAVAAGGHDVLALLPESPQHLYGYMILVTGEQPWMGITFGSATTAWAVRVLATIIAVALGLFICIYIRLRLFPADKQNR